MMGNFYTGILLYSGFSEYELSVVLSVLKQGGKPTIYMGLDHHMVKGESGLSCIPDSTISEVDISTLDSIVLPGVDDFEHLLNHEHLFSFLHHVHNHDKVMAAISSAPYLLSRAGALKGKKYTAGLTLEQRQFLGTFDEENYRNAPVVADGSIITAKGSAFIEFAWEVGDLLNLTYNKEWYRLNS